MSKGHGIIIYKNTSNKSDKNDNMVNIAMTELQMLSELTLSKTLINI